MNLRSFSGERPKAKLHTEADSMAWYPKLGSKQLIIVEDQLSAMRAADYVTAVALLGTNLNDERATRIRKETPGYQRYLALDQDAFDKAIKLTVQYRGLLGLRLLTLTKDLKNLTKDELDDFFTSNCGTCS